MKLNWLGLFSVQILIQAAIVTADSYFTDYSSSNTVLKNYKIYELQI